jgi:hypothetical protein
MTNGKHNLNAISKTGTGEGQANRETEITSSYLNRLTELIPSDVIATYLVIFNYVNGSFDELIKKAKLLIFFAILFLIVIPFYLRMLKNITSNTVIILSMASFIIWVLSIGQIPYILLTFGFTDQNIQDFQKVMACFIAFWTIVLPMFTKNIKEKI